MSDTLLTVKDLKTYFFPCKRSVEKAWMVSVLSCKKGETMGIVGNPAQERV